MLLSDLPTLLSEKEAAAQLRCSPATVARERRRKRIAHVLVSGRVFYTVEQIISYIENRTHIASRRDVDKKRNDDVIAPSSGGVVPSDAVAVARAVFSAKRGGRGSL
jgi:hypothetical protein